jgi:hypothetical protein
VGAKPGVTRHMRSIQLHHSPNVFLLDTPGVLRPKLGGINVALALSATGCIKDADRLIQSSSLAEFLIASLPTILEPASVVPALQMLGVDTRDPRIKPLLRLSRPRGTGLAGKVRAIQDPMQQQLFTAQEDLDVAVAVQAVMSQVAERVGCRESGGGFSERAAALHVVQCFRAGKLGKCCFDA